MNGTKKLIVAAVVLLVVLVAFYELIHWGFERAYVGPDEAMMVIKEFGDRPSIYRELTDMGGSRFHQLCTITPQYDRTLAHYRQAGYAVANSETNSQRRSQRTAARVRTTSEESRTLQSTLDSPSSVRQPRKTCK